MSKRAALCCAAGMVLGGAGAWLARPVGYLAAWFAWAGVPIGALAVLLLCEVAGLDADRIVRPALRRMAWLLPLAALLFAPVLLALPSVYPWAAGQGAQGAGGWLQPAAFAWRSAAWFAILILLAGLFARDLAPGARRGAALFALFLIAVVATLAVSDWMQSVDPGVHLGALGMQMLCGWAGAALAAALLLGGRQRGAVLLALAAGAWTWLAFTQLLVIWSADLPSEAAWLLPRLAWPWAMVAGAAFLLGGVLPALPACLPPGWQRTTGPVAAVGVLLAHGLEALWLLAPRLPGTLRVAAGIALLSGGGALLLFGAAALPARRARPAARAVPT